jgi:hypothetical protein
MDGARESLLLPPDSYSDLGLLVLKEHIQKSRDRAK